MPGCLTFVLVDWAERSVVGQIMVFVWRTSSGIIYYFKG